MNRIDVTEKIIATKVAKGLVVPYKGSLPTTVPVDPLIYRFYQLVNVYGTTERGQR
jgi:cyanate lyase